METQDLDEQLNSYISLENDNIRHAETVKGQPPEFMAPRLEMIHQLNRAKARQQADNHITELVKGTTMHYSSLPPSYPPCTTPLIDLEKIMLSSLRLEIHHRGKYLLLRTATQPFRQSGITVIVEDESNDGVMVLNLYHQYDEDERLKQGTILILKEPYLRVTGPGQYTLRADHVGDVLLLPPWDERVPSAWITLGEASAKEWKEKGNACSKLQKYHEAITFYTRALECSPSLEESGVIKSNRALPYLRIKQFDAALSDLVPLPTKPSLQEIATYRKALALEGLERYEDSRIVLSALQETFPNNGQIQRALDRVMILCEEQRTGVYNFGKMCREAEEQFPVPSDHATYDDLVEVRPSNIAGKGLFTTKAVKAGDLLLCEKATVYEAATPPRSRTIQTVVNAEHSKVTVGAEVLLLSSTLRKMQAIVSFMPTVAALHHNKSEPLIQMVDGVPIVDTLVVNEAIHLNNFAAEPNSREVHLSLLTSNEQLQEDSQQFLPGGLWMKAARVNHSCIPNAKRSFIGNMMIVRATRDLPADTELTFWYLKTSFDGHETREKLRDHWGFDCNCPGCEEFKGTEQEVFDLRRELSKKIFDAISSNQFWNPKNVEPIVEALAKTYGKPSSVIPRIEIWPCWRKIVVRHARLKQWVQVIETALKAFESLGFQIIAYKPFESTSRSLVVNQWGLMPEDVVDCWVLLAIAYKKLGLEDLAGKAKDYFKLLHRICFGEDETSGATFDVMEAWYGRRN